MRYWEDFQESFDIHWEDAVDNENIYLEHIIRVSEKPADTDEHGSTADGTINRVLYTVTVYRTNNKIQIQGNSRQHWVRKEFPELKKVIDDFSSESVETRSIVKSYWWPAGYRGTPKIFRYTGKILPVASLLQSAFSVSISGQH